MAKGLFFFPYLYMEYGPKGIIRVKLINLNFILEIGSYKNILILQNWMRFRASIFNGYIILLIFYIIASNLSEL